MYRRISKFILIAGLTSVTLIGSSSWKKSTKAESEPKRNKAPNVVLLVADDMGYSDLTMYGGEIPTPNIEALARQGMKFTNFHAQASCSPSRAMILSGVDNHQAGLGTMGELLADNQKGKPGYEGYLNNRVVTMAEVLKDGGYHTYIAGKWHLGDKPGYIPSDRGFEQSFTLIEGAADNYNPERGFDPTNPKGVHYRLNGQLVKPQNFYSTNYYTDRLIEFIDKNRQDNKPFLALATYTSPHEPWQAPKEDIQMFMGKYDMGWDKLRQERFDRQKKLGIIPANLTLPPRMDKVPAWDSLTPEKQRYYAKKMTAYAAMVKNLDDNIGRLIDHLKAIGEYDNTVFVFLSDNGAEGNSHIESEQYEEWFKKEGIDNSYENIGNANSMVGGGRPWGQVQATPFLWYKGRESEGGLRVPAIISYAGVKAGTQTKALSTVMDLMPTVLDYAGVKHPGNSYKGRPIIPMQGRSLRPLLEGKTNRIYGENDPIGYEAFGTGNSALYEGDWKILLLNPPFGDGKWKLFNITEDPRELNDLSQKYPDRLAKMLDSYKKYEKEKGVVLTEKLFDPACNCIPE